MVETKNKYGTPEAKKLKVGSGKTLIWKQIPKLSSLVLQPVTYKQDNSLHLYQGKFIKILEFQKVLRIRKFFRKAPLNA